MHADDTPDQVGMFQSNHIDGLSALLTLASSWWSVLTVRKRAAELMFLQVHSLQKSIKYLLLTWATSWLGVWTERKRCGRRGSTSGDGMLRVGSPA